MKTLRVLISCCAVFASVAACPPPPTPPHWQQVAKKLPNALLSVWGTSASDVWTVGSDTGDGKGPLVLHFDGTAWTRLDTNATGDLWWVFGFASGGPVFLGGQNGLMLKFENGAFTKMPTPGTAVVTGIWGASADDVWAVGAETGGARGAFAWRLQNGVWRDAPGFPPGLVDTDALWKVWGRDANDVWLVGSAGKTLHWDGTSFSLVSAGTGESLFTVHANSSRFVAVGGFGTGKLVENVSGEWINLSPADAPSLVGVALAENGSGFAVGQYGAVFARIDGGWAEERTGFTLNQSLHSVWIDPSGGVWAVGGEVLTFPLKDGVLLHRGLNDISEIP
ncbi:MAG: hypothetical protein QM817_32130 [Archangium sp.]